MLVINDLAVNLTHQFTFVIYRFKDFKQFVKVYAIIKNPYSHQLFHPILS